jgi:hypothetical protein
MSCVICNGYIMLTKGKKPGERISRYGKCCSASCSMRLNEIRVQENGYEKAEITSKKGNKYEFKIGLEF